MLKSFKELFNKLNKTQTYFIFCINPNDEKLPTKRDNKVVRRQLINYGIMDAIQTYKYNKWLLVSFIHLIDIVN